MTVEDVKVTPYNGARDRDRDIAVCHLRVRLWQAEVGQVPWVRRGASVTLPPQDWHRDLDVMDSQDDLHDIRRYYLESGGNLWVARDWRTWEVVGCVGLHRKDRWTAELKRLCVDPRYQGAGIGRRLVEALVDYAQAWATADCGAIRTVALGTGKAEVAHGLYRQYGFVVDGAASDDRDYAMRLELGAMARR